MTAYSSLSPKRRFGVWMPLLLTAFLAACGGGGGGLDPILFN